MLLIMAAVIGCIAASYFDSAAVGLLVANASVLTLAMTPRLGSHLELVSFSATAPGGTGAPATALAGDSLVVKGGGTGKIQIVGWWADQQVSGFQQVTFPSGHDTTRGIRQRAQATEVDQLLPEGIGITVQPQETLSVVIAGSAVAGQIETGSLLVLYPHMVGSSQRGIAWHDLIKRFDKFTTVDTSLVGTAAGYTGAKALNADSDLLLANRDYAVLGFSTSGKSATIAISGPDLGNVRVGAPANDLEPEIGMNYFPRMARALNLPLIPVINSGNKASTQIMFVQKQANVTIGVTLFLVLLAPAAR
jgi:hypothetical protein